MLTCLYAKFQQIALVQFGVVPVLLGFVAKNPHEFKLLHNVRDILCGLTFVAEEKKMNKV